ncbi:MAG: hypothetical protein WBB82_04215 [Limnothrix sp.]
MTNNILNSFGAEVNIALPNADQDHLFLIKSSQPLSYPTRLVQASGGKVLVQGVTWIIAQTTYGFGMGLKQEPGITFVGSVFLEPEKFLAFQRLYANSQQ